MRQRWALVALSLTACRGSTPPEAAEATEPVVDCVAAQPEEPTAAEIEAFCASDHGTSAPEFPPGPAGMADLEAKNTYDLAVRQWLRDRGYADWAHDEIWRLTGPAEEPLGGPTYGVHPGVRMWYSPEISKWLCTGREGAPPDGSMIIKEMVGLDALASSYEVEDGLWTPKKRADWDAIQPGSWTVMIRASEGSADGWYWMNPTATPGTTPSNRGNPPIAGRSASAGDPDSPDNSAPRNPDWYPTGTVFSGETNQPDVVYPYNAFGAYCLNCHASAVEYSTFASLVNILTDGIRYTRLETDQVCREWGVDPKKPVPEDPDAPAAPINPFPSPLEAPDPAFLAFYDQIEPVSFADAWPNRFPAETYDHVVSPAGEPALFVTSDQCIGCHDGTYSNSRTPYMVLETEIAGSEEKLNLSPYAEWRASPMGLAGRDPIFFAQLESETNHLPAELAACIETTCLQCHGVMGQRQHGIDTQDDNAGCESLFAVPPPSEVAFGSAYRRAVLDRWPGDGGEKNDDLHYAALSRDGISCAVCHRVSDTAMGTENSYTGNWVPGPPDALYGPYDDVLVKPMEHALGITPVQGKAIVESDLCGSCHNILLPVFDEQGERLSSPEGPVSKYEQSTHIEWKNSSFGEPGPTFQSCQDCHMPHTWDGQDLAFRIANIEDETFPETENRLPNAEIALKTRDPYPRHALHGLNLFLNQFFQQFPLMLGLRQIDYMTGTEVRPGLLTARDSMLAMAERETAVVTVPDVKTTETGIEATVRVENLVGHYLPSGVGFRRVILEVEIADANGDLVWASGKTSALGAVVDGLTDELLAFERPHDNPEAWEPHHQRIERSDQVQIYEEVVAGSDGEVNTSFLRRVDVLKDNRLRPKGFDPEKLAESPSHFIRNLAEDGPQDDDFYTDPALTGADELVYAVALGADVVRPVTVRARLWSQSIPPAYLQDRFAAANVGAEASTDIERLYAITSHLDTRVEDNAGSPFMEGWKIGLGLGKAVESSE